MWSLAGGLVTSVLLFWAWTTSGFNVDTLHPLIYSDPSPGTGQTYFGYSAALHTDMTNENSPKHWLLVGAPRANSTYQTHVGIPEPGVMYKCSIGASEGPDRCHVVVVDQTGNSLSGHGDTRYKDRKNHAWLGAAMDVQPDSGRLAVCGPRWKNQRYDGHYLMNGACYWMTGDMIEDDVDKLLPLVGRVNQGKTVKGEELFYYAFGEAGFSIHFPDTPKNESQEMLIGAPGVLDWTGTVMLFNDSADFISEASSRRRRAIARSGLLNAFEDLIIPDPLKTGEIEMFDLFGYAVSSGKFSDEEEMRIFYVAGAPRAALYKGKVIIFLFGSSEEAPLDIRKQIEGEQMGEYFGSALCSTDLNGDGLDDLLVGAPLYTLSSVQGMVTGDEGRVYVFINEGKWRFTETSEHNKHSRIMGRKKLRAHFGASIMAVGDLNMDGYNDVAIGAPYETDEDPDVNGSGAVYIYHGSKTGIRPQYSQRIGTSSYMPLKGFGISISRGRDIDGNFYQDLSVGAFESGHAAVFRSQPVISFKADIKPIPERLSDDATQFQLHICISYHGKSVPGIVGVDLTLNLDTLYRPPRVYIENHGDKRHTLHYKKQLTEDREACENFIAYLKKGALDRSKPVKIELAYQLEGTGSASVGADGADGLESGQHAVWIRPDATSGKDQFCKVCPVLDPHEAGRATRTVAFATDCGDDNVCFADLKVYGNIMDYDSSNPYPIGKTRTLTLDAFVANSGEPAYLPKVQVAIPLGVTLTRLPQSCQEIPGDEVNENMRVLCDLPGPLLQDAEVKKEIVLDMTQVKGGRENLKFSLSTFSSSEKVPDSSSDDSYIIILPLKTEADMTISGRSDRQQYLYSKDTVDEAADGMRVTFMHHYEVTNYGPSPVDSVDLEFLIPETVTAPDGSNINFLQLYAPKAYLNQRLTCYREAGSFFTGDPVSQTGNNPDIDNLFDEDDVIEARKRRSTLDDVNEARRRGSAMDDAVEVRKRRSASESWLSHELRTQAEQEKNIIARLKIQANRTLILRCPLSSVKCIRIWCSNIGPFITKEDRATVDFESIIDISKLEPLMEEKDVVLVMSLGWLRMIQPEADVQPTPHKPDLAQVITKFVGSLPEKTVAIWIIVLAVLGGLLLLVLITVGLVKLGFFKRQKYEALQQKKGNKVEPEKTDGDHAEC